MENKINLRTEHPTSILAQRLKEIKKRLTKYKSISETEFSEIDSIVNMLENLDRYIDECTSAESKELSDLNELTMRTDWSKIFSEKKSQVKLMTQMMSSKVSAQ